jgi:hypothetical protein
MTTSRSARRRVTRRDPRPSAVAAASSPPYHPSWFDRLKRRLETLPGPFWLPYLIVWIVLFVLETLIHWSASAYPIGTARPFHAIFTVMLPGALCLTHALDRLADRSFRTFRPVLHGPEAEADELRFRLTTMSRRRVNMATAGFMVFGVVMEFGPLVSGPSGPSLPTTSAFLDSFAAVQLSPSPASIVFNLILLLLTWVAIGTLIYHTIHQLTWVSRIYTQRTHVDLLKPGALYSLSRISAGTALGMMAITYIILGADRRFFRDPRNLISAAIFAGLAVLAFILPLLGAHRALVAEKSRMLDESADRLKVALAELHKRVDRGNFKEMDALNKAIASLDIERNLLSRVPTWPWQPETLRTVIVALLLPLILWTAQAILARLLG